MKLYFLIFLLLLSCSPQDTTPFLKGVSNVPPTWSDEDVIRAYTAASKAGEVILIQDVFDYNAWKENSSVKIEEAKARKQLADSQDLKIYLAIDSTRDRNVDFSDPSTRETLTKGVRKLVEIYEPDFLALGVEVNYYYLEKLQEFESYITLYNELYSELKHDYPELPIFVTYQYEAAVGKQKGIPQHWEVLEMIENTDAMAISLHPYYKNAFGNPGDIPDGYLSPLQTYGKPIIIAETGWNDADEQPEYVLWLFNNARKMNMTMVVWYSLHDTDTQPEDFTSLGLLYKNGNPKKAYELWTRP